MNFSKTETPNPPADARLNVLLKTDDSLNGSFSVCLHKGRRHQSQIDWPKGVSDGGTMTVVLELSIATTPSRTWTISGDTWRDLESRDLEDEFLDRVLQGLDPHLASAELLDLVISYGDQIAYLSKASSRNGYDDFDVHQHASVHRVTVSYNIRQGDICNLYCKNGRKEAASWAGDYASTLADRFHSLDESAAS